MEKKNKLYRNTEHDRTSIYEVVCESIMSPGRVPCVTYRNIDCPDLYFTKSKEEFNKRYVEIEPRINPKYIHYFSLNFQITSDIEGKTDQEVAQLYAEVKSMVEEIVEQGKAHVVAPYCLEWHDTEYFDDVHGAGNNET